MNDVSVLYIDSFRQGTGLKESQHLVFKKNHTKEMFHFYNFISVVSFIRLVIS